MSDIILYNPPQKQTEINIWMAFPAMASFGMSSLGYMSIVKRLDMRSDYYVEKIFSHYQPNVGEIFVPKNEVAQGEVIGTIYDNPELLGVEE